jgi:hypothetical protein
MMPASGRTQPSNTFGWAFFGDDSFHTQATRESTIARHAESLHACRDFQFFCTQN